MGKCTDLRPLSGISTTDSSFPVVLDPLIGVITIVVVVVTGIPSLWAGPSKREQ
jgi:hypothetical protein